MNEIEINTVQTRKVSVTYSGTELAFHVDKDGVYVIASKPGDPECWDLMLTQTEWLSVVDQVEALAESTPAS